MHMADALVSPTIGAIFWSFSASAFAWSAHKLKGLANNLVPMMGVLGAFIFSVQMINFSIPITGSSGHLGGGLILAALLGPHAALIVMASILTIQSLFFADGGLLALGCNIFNMGFIPTFIIFPLIKKAFSKRNSLSRPRLILGGILALQLGALCVVVQTSLSGVSELPFGKFLILMLPIHLGIGIIEGVATAVIVEFILKARPALFAEPQQDDDAKTKQLVPVLLVVTILTAAGFSWLASSNPDGLEWSIKHVAGSSDLSQKRAVHQQVAEIQHKTALFPGYDFSHEQGTGTPVAGLVGGALTLALASLFGFIFHQRKSAL